MKRISDVISIIFIAIAATFFVMAGSFPEGSNGATGPGWFPRIMCVIIILLSVINLVTTNIDFAAKSEEEKQKDRSIALKLLSKDNMIVWVTIIATLLYVLGIQYVGFVVSSIVYMLVMNLYYKVPEINKPAAFIIPFAVTGVLYYVFTNLLHVVLPSGFLI